jgi:hypothetical protein
VKQRIDQAQPRRVAEEKPESDASPEQRQRDRDRAGSDPGEVR